MTVSVVRKTGGDHDSDITVSAGASLTFTTDNWDTNQTVTLAAAEDTDGLDGTAVIVHTASGGGYGSVTAELTATESDNDRGITLSATAATVTEGATADHSVKLATQPTASVTVSVARKTGGDHDTDITVSAGSTLTFTTDNWDTNQTVTLAAAEDSDGLDGAAVIVHTASGGGYGSVSAELTATEADNDRGITLSATTATVAEGATADHSVKLATQPTASVTVTVARKTGGDHDTDITVSAGSTLTFTTDNWNTNQTVTLAAAEDSDGLDGAAVIVHTAAGGGYNSVTAELTATEADNDRGITLSATAATVAEGSTKDHSVKLATQPTASVTVTVARKTGGDHDTDITVSAGSSLTFTIDNWDTNQTVTLAAAEDSDGLDGTAVIVHTATGGGYNSVTAELTATEGDNDRGITLSAAAATVAEGSTKDHSVKLATQPTASVTVSVARKTGNDHDSDITVSAGSSLTFTTDNWDTNQTVTLAAAEDSDGLDGAAVIVHTASGGGYGSVTAELTATEADNDRGITLSATAATVTEGATADHSVKLATQPTASVTVTVARKTGGDHDTDITVSAGSTLTFTTDNWDTNQTVTLAAAEDSDGLDGTAVIVHTATGGGYNSVTAELTATEGDNDRGITLSATAATVTEGATADHGVKLATQPTASVTVSVARKTGGDHDTDITVSAGSTLTFTTDNWDTNQTVTLAAAEDSDGLDGAAVIVHTAAGGGYGSVSAELTATEADNDRGITLSATAATVTEGATADHSVKLATQPTASVTVTVARKTGNDHDSDITVSAGSTLTFTTDNWDTNQTVTLSAAEDADGLDGTAVIVHTASGGGYGSETAELTATEGDNDRGITLSAAAATVAEGSTKDHSVKLATQPTASVTVTVARKTGGDHDTDITVSAGSTLTFTTDNWDTNQTVTLSAAEDTDGLDGAAVIVHTASGGGYGSVSAELTATEADNDRGITLSATTATVAEGATADHSVKLATQPTASVTVTVARKTGGDHDSDITVSAGSTLTFTTDNWNTNQTVTLAAAEDSDGLDGTAVIVHTASGGGYGSVSAELTATEADNDRSITLSATTATVAEGATADHSVKLATQPTASVTVSVARKTGNDQDSDITVSAGSTLTFTTDNWDTNQTVTLAAAEDSDGLDGTAVIVHTAAGGGYGSVTAELTATEGDNDRGITLSATAATVAEGATADHSVKLATQPTASVTVSVARKTGGDHDTDITVSAGSTLTFTTDNWDTNQTVTLAAAEDSDGLDGTAVIVHTAAGGGYNSVTAELTATEGDNDRGITLSAATATVTEGATADHSVKLATQPTASVTVTVARKTGGDHDTDITVSAGSTLTFTTDNWDTNQTVTLAAAEDGDGLDGTAVIVHTAAGGGYNSVTAELTATEDDNDRGITLSATTATVTEGATADHSVKLATQPTASVTVTVARKTGGDHDTDITVSAGSTLTFTTDNWDTNQTVTLAAAEDGDGLDGTAVIVHTAAGGGYNSVTAELTATEADNDRGITLSAATATVAEGATADHSVKLATQPTASVTVTVARKTGGDHDTDITVSAGSTLTFTTDNWDTNQTVTLAAAEDSDGLDGAAVIVHTASGGGYGSVTAELTATEADNDRGITLSATAATVAEGSTKDHSVKLATQPTASVTVTVARKTGADQDSDITVSAGSTLTFTTDNWDTNQTVTLAAAEDSDGLDGAAVIVHTASGGGYGSVTAELTATEADNDRGITLSAATATVAEDSTANYSVKLATQPTASVTVSVARKTGGDQDSDITVSAGSSLTFTTDNWDTNQTVTLAAAEDSDGLDGAAVIVHTASGGGYGSVSAELTATEADNDRSITLSATAATVAEGSTKDHSVKLATQPTASVTVTVARKTGGDHDTDITVSAGASLTFTTDNWDTNQTVTLAAAEDSDGLDGTAVIVHTASGGGYGSVTAELTATEADNDRGITLSATAATVAEGSTKDHSVKLATQPSASVTVSVARKTGGDHDTDITVSAGSSLTFTTDNWDTNQTVTLAAAEDSDGLDGTAVIVHTATGGGYNSVTAELTATEGDNDRGITLSATAATVTEGATADHSVKLATQPTASVTVTVARKTGGDHDTDITVSAGSSLTFTTDNWDTNQTVTLAAAEDSDGLDGTAVIVHTATGGGYNSVTAELTATEGDNDRGITLSAAAATVAEGSTKDHSVKLATQPTASVTVTVARKTGGDHDTDITVSAGSTLTFTTDNWDTNQTVTLAAAEDTDGLDGTAVIVHTASGGGYGSVTAELTATEADNDRGITLSATTATVAEDSTANYSVKLATQPTASVTVTVARKTGNDHDTDITVSAGSSLTFTTDNWDTNQTVTLAAAEDSDGLDGTAVIVHTATGGGYNSVTAELTATEGDNDRGITLSATAATVAEGSTKDHSVKLATQPTASVTVSVARKTGGDHDTDITVSAGSSLTFTTDNWDTNQTVTLAAAEDSDGLDGTAVIVHTATGGGYGSVTAELTATEDDNDRGITLSASAATVAEGSTADHGVKLSTAPSASVTVSVARKTGGDHDSDITVSAGSRSPSPPTTGTRTRR